MRPPEILREVRAHGGRPRLVDGIVVTDRIEDRRLLAVFRDALDWIVELLREEQQSVPRKAA